MGRGDYVTETKQKERQKKHKKRLKRIAEEKKKARAGAR